ncbi:PepSY domain-containing protein [Aquidulcibacter sp.]|uniref:PepSY domain-containing protein n=1 Tax=Aquidulcibacter sp. TaxID=2052990 RepID=UPI0025BFFDEC|nr:PepSY domain-containing protein [Aquidulcibacter sp.]MCA3696590.1 PepSY domain-containing protein [Aquidulcibacter sp.]
MKRIGPCLVVILAVLAGCAQPQHSPAPAEAVEEAQHEGPVQPASNNLPFLKVQAIALAAVPGEVVKVDLENEHGQDVYEFKILAPSGRVIELEIAAATGQILKREAD